MQIIEPIVGVVQERLQGAESRVDALLADREELRFSAVDRLLDLGGVLVPDAGYPPRRPDQVSENGLALDDPSVLRRVDGRRCLVREARQVGSTPD
jgi:hypothetical protein